MQQQQPPTVDRDGAAQADTFIQVTQQNVLKMHQWYVNTDIIPLTLDTEC